jgi:hypothetical protein
MWKGEGKGKPLFLGGNSFTFPWAPMLRPSAALSKLSFNSYFEAVIDMAASQIRLLCELCFWKAAIRVEKTYSFNSSYT